MSEFDGASAGVALAERESIRVYPLPPDQYADINNVYTKAEHLLPSAPYHPMRGKPEHAFTMFVTSAEKADYAVVIPFRGYGVEHDARKEIQDLTDDTLRTEPMQLLYRHGYMLHRFAGVERVHQELPILVARIDSESSTFSAENEADDEKRRDVENQFYYLKLACLERCEDEPDMRISSEMVANLYDESLTTRPRSIHAALVFDQRNKEAESSVSVRSQVHDYLAEKLIDPELANEKYVTDVLKWSYSDQELQTDLLRESLLQTDGQEQIELVTRRFSAAMEVYDITTYLQEYALEHTDFAPKLKIVLDFLEKNPVGSDIALRKILERHGNSREAVFAEEPIPTDFRTEEHPSAASEAQRLEEFTSQDALEGFVTELTELTEYGLEHELFRDFYRHMDMLIKFGDAATVAKFLPTILRRGRIGAGPQFAHLSLPQNEFSNQRSGLPEELKRQAYLKIMGCIEVCEEDPTVRLPVSVVKDLADGAREIDPRFIRYALVFDDRNKMYGESDAKMEKNLIEDGVRYLTEPSELYSESKERGETMVPWLYVRPELYSQILLQSLHKSLGRDPKAGAIRVVQGLAPHMGVERIRKTLREYMASREGMPKGYYDEKIEAIFEYMQMDPDGRPVAVDLVRDVYDQVDMAVYKPNDELLQTDIAVINKTLEGAENIADVACGTGRHLFSLENRQVTGFDLVPKHIAYIKSLDPAADVHEASWFDLPAQDGQFDGALMLGRSFAHNTTIFDAVACLQEMKRVIKDDGSILLDLPDGGLGDYKELIAHTIGKAQAQGIENILPGTIMDSPDNEHYFDRYIPDAQAFQALCELAGLDAEQVDQAYYIGDSEEKNVNVYWKLTKKPVYEVTSIDRVAALIETIRTDRYTTRKDHPMSVQTTPASSSQSAGGE